MAVFFKAIAKFCRKLGAYHQKTSLCEFLLGKPDAETKTGLEKCSLDNPCISCDPQKSPDTPGSPEGNTEGPGTASSEPLLPS